MHYIVASHVGQTNHKMQKYQQQIQNGQKWAKMATKNHSYAFVKAVLFCFQKNSQVSPSWRCSISVPPSDCHKNANK